ncbi:hypothetical protein [Mangrovicoccus ximenensis]|uniref:hypothetical protein n=1 Tax=Mangrovicoccus ximenensis TaxID=1911570 RepID=UPI0011AEB955|nr:hypothetical protein [Mangrovicoccus ximenensis]
MRAERIYPLARFAKDRIWGGDAPLAPKGMYDGQDHSTETCLDALRDARMARQLEKHFPLALGAPASAAADN